MGERPNILHIMVDQQRYDCIGFSGDYPVLTPNVDRLASQGIWFSNAFTHIPLCSPARQSFVNGRRPESFGSLWNYNLGLKIPALEPKQYSWARELKALQYRTGYIGKWNVHPIHEPASYGYDYYIGPEQYERFIHERYPDVKYTASFMGERDPLPLEHARTHWMARQAIELMGIYASQNEPWHIRLNFSEPHLPCRPAGKFADMYAPENVPMWRSFNETFENKPYIQKQQLYNWEIQNYTWDDWAPIVARYYGVISQLDDAIGLVLAAVSELGIDDNTIVMYTADHGDMCGGHRMMDKHYIMYDDVVKVPLIIRWPKKIKPGQICDRFVYNLLDVPPTILEWLGVKVPDFFHGRSLVPLLNGQSGRDWRNEVVATYNGQQFGLYTQRMIRNNEWKYVWNTTDVDELYNLREDPEELHNVIYESRHSGVLQQLRETLYCTLKEEGDTLVDNMWMKNQLLKGSKL